MGIRISKDHLHPSVIESITSLIGDLNQLETTAKGNAVEAINELLANGGNKEELEALIAEIAEGKELIANAVGEPLTAEESFDEMSSDINGLLSTFKTNMMNNGITVESSDRFKALIDKVATMVEEGEGKGIQFASGSVTLDGNNYFQITDLGFTPSFVVYMTKNNEGNRNSCLVYTSDYCYEGYRDGDESSNVLEGIFIDQGDGYYYSGIYILENGFEVRDPDTIYEENLWFAIGVGEEDTTLRDSLASILEEEGVDITEEDDMASLITKVDEEFENRKNNMISIISEGDVIFYNKSTGDIWNYDGYVDTLEYNVLIDGIYKVNHEIHGGDTGESYSKIVVKRDGVVIKEYTENSTYGTSNEFISNIEVIAGDKIILQSWSEAEYYTASMTVTGGIETN